MLNRDAQAYFVLEMVRHQTKPPEEVWAALAKGAEIVRAKLPQVDSGNLGDEGHDVLSTNILMREAEEMIEKVR